MKEKKENIQLDESLKLLCSETSDMSQVNLINSIFDEDYNVGEIEISTSNSEFIGYDLDVIRADMLYDLRTENSDKVSFHIEFQIANDPIMVIRTFEYGFKKARRSVEKAKDNIHVIRFPKQKVIYFEKNKAVKDSLNLKIILPNDTEVLYTVGVIKYWEFTIDDLIRKKMFLLIPLQLFNFRKRLNAAEKKGNHSIMKDIEKKMFVLAGEVSKIIAELHAREDILWEDFEKMLATVDNLMAYFNRNYFKSDTIEEEVKAMTKSLYDPELVKKTEMETEIKTKLEIAKNLLEDFDDAKIANKTGLELEVVKELRKENKN